MSRAAAITTPGPWIVGSGYDQLFLWGAWCVPFLLWAVAMFVPNGLLVAFVVFVLLDNSHQVATLPLTVLDPGTMRRSASVYLGGAAAIAATAIVISLFPGSFVAQLWASLVLYWGAWHIIRQHYGFLRLYQARDKPSGPRVGQAEVIALYSGASFPYFLNLSHGWAAHGVGEMLYKVPVPAWSPWVVLAIFAAASGYVLQDALARSRSGEAVLTRRLLHVLLVVSNFWVGLLWIGREDLLLAVLFITSYHDLQYHAVVWLIGRKRTAPASAPVYAGVRRLFGSLPVFAAVLVAGAVVQGLLRNDFQLAGAWLPQSATTVALFAVFTSYSYMHYFFDGKMWKLSSDPRLRAELGLGSKATPAVVATTTAERSARYPAERPA